MTVWHMAHLYSNGNEIEWKLNSSFHICTASRCNAYEIHRQVSFCWCIWTKNNEHRILRMLKHRKYELNVETCKARVKLICSYTFAHNILHMPYSTATQLKLTVWEWIFCWFSFNNIREHEYISLIQLSIITISQTRRALSVPRAKECLEMWFFFRFLLVTLCAATAHFATVYSGRSTTPIMKLWKVFYDVKISEWIHSREFTLLLFRVHCAMRVYVLYIHIIYIYICTSIVYTYLVGGVHNIYFVVTRRK